MHEAGRALEYDGIGEFDVSGEAVGLDADAARDGSDRPDRRTQRQRCRVTNVGEIPEAAHRDTVQRAIVQPLGLRW